MTRYEIQLENEIIEVCIYQTEWRMHYASIRYKEKKVIADTTHGKMGACYMWDPSFHRRVVAVIMMSWDTITIDTICHELLHATLHIYTRYRGKRGKINANNEEFALLHSDLVDCLLSIFTPKQMRKLISNQQHN